eukprot:6345630-Amphidinium_carterae.1
MSLRTWSSSLVPTTALAFGATFLQQRLHHGDPCSVTALAPALAFAFVLALALAAAAALAQACFSAYRATSQHLCQVLAQCHSVCPLFPASAQQVPQERHISARSD